MTKVKAVYCNNRKQIGRDVREVLALAERGVEHPAFQSYVEEGESWSRLVVDNPAGAKAVLGGLRMIFEETAAARNQGSYRPGEAGPRASRWALRLKNRFNID